MQLKTLFMSVLSLLFLSACTTTKTFTRSLIEPSLPGPESIVLFDDDTVDKAEAISDGRVTALLFITAEDSTSEPLKNQLHSKLIGDLNEVGVDDLNRNEKDPLHDEFKAIMMGTDGEVEYEGPVEANYAVFARFIESSYTVSYDKPWFWFWINSEEYKKKQGSCDYEVTVHIGVKIKEISAPARRVKTISKRTVKTINVKETKKGSIRTTDPNCRAITAIERRTLELSATKDAAACLTAPLQKFLAPRGRIAGNPRMDKKGRYFFPVSTGKEGGLKAGDHIKIFNITEMLAHDRHEQQVAEGYIHSEIGPTHSWVVVDDETEAIEIKKGNVAKVSYQNMILGSIERVKCRSIRTES